MHWKSILFQSLLTLIAVFVGLRLFNPQGEVNQSLHSIKESLARLETRIESSGAQTPPLSSAPPGIRVRPMGKDPTAWIQELPEAKRKQVEEVFKQQQAFVRERLSGGPSPNPETMKALMEENDQMLREKLKAVLNENEYQKFSESLPRPPSIEPPPLPASKK